MPLCSNHLGNDKGLGAVRQEEIGVRDQIYICYYVIHHIKIMICEENNEFNLQLSCSVLFSSRQLLYFAVQQKWKFFVVFGMQQNCTSHFSYRLKNVYSRVKIW